MLTITEMIDSVEEIPPAVHDVERVNAIADKYPEFRQQSKMPTFLLTYDGSWRGIVDQTGWSEDKARSVEGRYHELYQVSDQWVAARIQEASKCGYVTTAFGLRVRTPILHQAILGNRQTPKEAAAEARTAGNALGQGWGLLNTRASVEFMSKVRAHPEYRTAIRPCSHIHDAQYHLIRDDMAMLVWMNTHLVQAVEWQDDPLIAHPEVKLGGELSIFYPSWAEELSLPNHASEEKIKELAMKHHAKYCGDLIQ